MIGYDDLNGKIPSDKQSEVTAWIQVVYDKYTVKTSVRKFGDKDGVNAFTCFTAEVVNTDLAYGKNFIYDWWRVTVDNSLVENSLVENSLVVKVQKPE